MVAPPLDAGAVKETDACALPAEAVPMVGAPGTVALCELTVTWAVAEDDRESLSVAVRVKVYVPAVLGNVAEVERLVGEVMVTLDDGETDHRYVIARLWGSEAVPVRVAEFVGRVMEDGEAEAETVGGYVIVPLAQGYAPI